MNAGGLGRLFAVAFVLSCCTSPPAAADLLEGRVIRIADGDTLTVLDRHQVQHRVRLAGIDAPERGQPFGESSKQDLARLTFGKPVEIRWHKRDRYGRLVGQVWVVSPDARCQGAGCPKTLDAGLAQVTVGLAWQSVGALIETMRPRIRRGRIHEKPP